MRQYVAFILNLPWTIVGLLSVPLSVPVKVQFSKKPLAIVFHVKSFWWYSWLPGYAKVRAMANGHCVQLGPRADEADREHELIHVEQSIREPFVHQLLYIWETRMRGYRQNKYEREAYDRSGSRYEGS